mgnify:FL=1|tara:strand:- start:559 stop:1140 length:582 start_codon:yes stop_codon:yes gene_type:complete
MALASNVNDFLQRVGQGVKPNMFEVRVPFPTALNTGGADDEIITLLCKSTNLPGSSLGSIDVPFRGRTVKIVGDRTFDNWSAVFFNDKEMKIRSRFEKWMESMNTHEGNSSPLFTPGGTAKYMSDVEVDQLEKNSSANGDVLRSYKLWHAFPTSISQIDLAYDSNDQIEEFTVEFQMSYWTVEDGGKSGISIA